MNIAMIQMNAAEGNVMWNVEHAFSLMEEAVRGMDLIVLPELWTVGCDFHNLERRATRPGDGLLEKLSAFARTHRVNLAAGTLPVWRGGGLFNESFLFGRDGQLVGTYCKQHLFDGYLEGKLMQPGHGLLQVDMECMLCGMGICYELYFPDMYRNMAKAGTTLILVPASWPLVYIEKWEILVRARAIENGVYMCAVNMAGIYHGIPLGGHSLMVDPEGKVLAKAGEKEEVLYVEIHPEKYPDLGKQLAVIRKIRNGGT